MALQRDIPKLRRASTNSASKANAASAPKAAISDCDIAAIALRPAKDWTLGEKESVCRWLCREKYDDLLRQAVRMLGDYHAAEDVMQEFLMDLVASTTRLSQFNPEKGQLWPTYIKACFTNFTVKACKRRREEYALTTQLEEIGRVVPPRYDSSWLGERFGVAEHASTGQLSAVEKAVEHERCLAFMRDCFAKLKPKEQEAFYLVEFDGWNPSELAVKLGTTAEAWRKRLQRARAQMSKCVTRKYRLRWASESRKVSSSASRSRP